MVGGGLAGGVPFLHHRRTSLTLVTTMSLALEERVEGKGMPEDVVMVHVSVGVKNGAVSQRLFEEGPADEVGAGI